MWRSIAIDDHARTTPFMVMRYENRWRVEMSPRQTVVICLRGLAVGLAMTGLVFAVAGFLRERVERPHTNDLSRWWWWWWHSEEVCWAIPIAVVSIALWVFQRPLSRLIAPRSGRICPECGYDLRKLKSGNCPECGFEFRK